MGSFEYKIQEGSLTMGSTSQIQETQGEKDQAAMAEELYQDYKTRFQPIEKKNAETALKSEGYRRNIETGLATASARKAVDQAQTNVNTTKMARGINPNSGNFTSANAGNKGAKIVAGAGASADVNNSAGHLSKLGVAISRGRGNQSSALRGMNTVANLQVMQERAKAEAAAIENAAVGELAGTAASIGVMKMKGGSDFTQKDAGFTVQKQSRNPTKYDYLKPKKPMWEI